ncbi:MAG: GNAT family N-acetyltransferase [Deltaproteobacteria bacterium]|nr:GNAT family N-acetyltransferase [Deltaproteobacteria bacterium]
MTGIHRCAEEDFKSIYAVITKAARAYQGVIPPDCWKDPYMTEKELRREIAEGVCFFVYEEEGVLIGVMGIQHVRDVSLIRHAYVFPARQRRGIGGKLLSALCLRTDRPILLGTWADAAWAVHFYEKYGFKSVPLSEKDGLLRNYWHVSERQVETSVVLADQRWFELTKAKG